MEGAGRTKPNGRTLMDVGGQKGLDRRNQTNGR
jgi:hypothetical protein